MYYRTWSGKKRIDQVLSILNVWNSILRNPNVPPCKNALAKELASQQTFAQYWLIPGTHSLQFKLEPKSVFSRMLNTRLFKLKNAVKLVMFVSKVNVFFCLTVERFSQRSRYRNSLQWTTLICSLRIIWVQEEEYKVMFLWEYNLVVIFPGEHETFRLCTAPKCIENLQKKEFFAVSFQNGNHAWAFLSLLLAIFRLFLRCLLLQGCELCLLTLFATQDRYK